MKIVAVMPIKLNNERCPGKNIRALGKKPLLQYELDNLKETELCDNIYVYCSSNDIIPYIPKGIEFLKRSTDLDLPTANFNQIFSAFLEEKDADIYVFLHATAPFIKMETMRECIEAVKNGGYDSAFCAEKIQTFLWQDGKPLNFDATNLPRTQDLKPIYKETSGIYVFKKEVFLEYGRRIGIRPFVKCVDFKEMIDIDNPEDFDLAEVLIDIKL